ncbi:MAG TPA: hypothetical protein VHA33_24415 [Candidatus Angelobacter sp.]|jgi:hypothetical protein|nr:hypothetical protein [Candidatus Angelobacter sp.]
MVDFKRWFRGTSQPEATAAETEAIVSCISRAVQLFRSTPALKDEEMFRVLVQEDMEPRVAAHCVEFLPLAYSRMLLMEAGSTRFPQSFLRVLPNGKFKTHRFDSEPIWNAIVSFAKTERKSITAAKDLLAIAGRCAIFNAVNDALHAGSKLQDLLLSEPALLWPEDGPTGKA